MELFRILLAQIIALSVLLCVQSSIAEQTFNWNRIERNVSAERQSKAVNELLERLLPDKVNQFELIVDSDFEDKDAFEISSRNDKIFIKGNKGYSVAAGVYHYLKTYCGCHISWSGYQLNVPDYLPRPPEPLKVIFNDKYRYYQNVCTYSYSYVWWTWNRWEREIDWMALNGINLALAFTAQEAITLKIFKFLNFTQHDLNMFFTGPAFLAWNRMGNIQFWGQPLTENWHENQVRLQHQILDRMRDFGMTPVLPAFSGRVVPGFNRLFPNASTTYLNKTWGNFEPPIGYVTFLEPTDPLFQELGSMFLRSYIEEFGTDHVYSADLFNEMPPPSNDPKYLEACGKSLFKSLITVDPEATWIVQGWMFYSDPDIWEPSAARAFLRSVPLGKMIVLDLQAELYPQYERLDSYYGQPFIWCMLHNYGGVDGLYASLPHVNNGTFEAREFKGSTMIGTGLAPEGIETNDIAYEFMNEMAWRNDSVNLDSWLEDYAVRRYGMNSSDIFDALKLLKKSVYNASIPYRNHGKYILIRRPSFRLQPYVWYDPRYVFDAWKLFLNSSKNASIAKSHLYRHDLVDLTRQSLQLVMDVKYFLYVKAFRQKKLNATRNIAQSILQLFKDIDKLLLSDDSFLLGKWLNDAKNLALTPLERRNNEFNARNQITLWGPSGQILDYANKQWSGLMIDYYMKRWQLFFDVVDDCLIHKKQFNQNSFNSKVLDTVESDFNLLTDVYPKTSKGDSIQISKRLYKKYSSVKHMFGRSGIRKFFARRNVKKSK